MVNMVHCISVINVMINVVGLVCKKLVVQINHVRFAVKNKYRFENGELVGIKELE